MILKDHLAVVMSGLYREVVEVGIPVTKLQLNLSKRCDGLERSIGNIVGEEWLHLG